MRKYKYIWLPTLLAVYFLFMTFYFGTDLLRQGETTRFWLTVGAELAVLTALAFFLKRRERLRMEREKDIADTSRDRYKKL
ncbi:MAG: hypothetical protein K2K98_12130 [Muribaculaceae bacterium]|nr:hypothetical protein [Muribaculaceae bacterium]